MEIGETWIWWFILTGGAIYDNILVVLQYWGCNE